MAASDYNIRIIGSLTPTGLLDGTIAPLDTTMTIENFQTVVTGGDLFVGMGALIGEEIIRIDSITLPTLTIARGCADTIPAAHSSGERVWFFSRSLVADKRQYVANTTIGVKGLPFTEASGHVPIASAPPHSLTMSWRHARPYPPGDVRVNDDPWFDRRFLLGPVGEELVLTWVHRNRVVQADVLVDHTAASITKESSATYTINVYDHTHLLQRSVTGLTGTTWAYTSAMMVADMPEGSGYIYLTSMRAGLESWQGYEILVCERIVGLGEGLGENLGG